MLRVRDENAKHLKFWLERNSRKYENTGILEPGHFDANNDSPALLVINSLDLLRKEWDT